MDCLEGHRHTDGFGPDCRATLETAMEARAMDFRLDSSLRQVTFWGHCYPTCRMLWVLWV